MESSLERIKKAIFAELKFWDDATTGDCEDTESLMAFYNLWNMVCRLGWKKEYEVTYRA